MSKKLYEESSIQDIATAIREKNGTTTKYKVAEMGAAIRALFITNIIDTIGISANTILGTGSGSNITKSGYATIGANKDAASLIHLTAGDTLRVKGVSLPESKDNYSAIAMYKSDGTFINAAFLRNEFIWNNLKFKNSGDNVVITCSADRYFRISLICTDASAVIATINERIT